MKNIDFIHNQKNRNYILAGISLLMINIASKYLIIDISDSFEKLLKLKIVRRITLFCIFYYSTSSIYLSFILTATFIVIADNLFNENSKFYILPKSINKYKITDDEYNKALSIVNKYNSQKIVKNDNNIIENYKEVKSVFKNIKSNETI